MFSVVSMKSQFNQPIPRDLNDRVALFDNLNLVIGDYLVEEAREPMRQILQHIQFSQLIREEGQATYYALGFIDAPAAKGHHHSFLGGLVHHLLEMWDIHLQISRRMFSFDSTAEFEKFNSDVLLVILLHDLHKGAWEYTSYVDPATTKDPFVSFDYQDKNVRSVAKIWQSQERVQLQKEQLVFFMAQQFGLILNIEVYNALLSAEGGWSNNPARHPSVFAKYTYLLDEMSGNIADRLNSGRLTLPSRPDKDFIPYRNSHF